MAEYTLTIVVQGVDQTAPATQGMERLGVGGIAAGNIIADALQKAAGAVVGFVGASISAAGDFQQGMNVLQAASGATSAQMQQMGDLAVALGNDMTLPGASASDAATAMLELSKAGLSVNDTMDAAKGTLQLAAAAETDAATAAGIVAGALNAFHLEGSQAAMVADQLAAGANASAASITDLSQGFQAAGFAFNATGQKTDDLITSLSMLTNVGLTGSDAGTALKNAMMQLMAPTDAAAKTMAQYGINVRDAQGNMLPFRDIIGVLQTHLSNLSPAARDAALKTMLMGDGMKAMLPLIEAGVSGFDAMKAKVDQAGAAQQMAAAQMQGFNGALAGVGNAAETLQLVIGQALIPILTALFNDAVSPAINGITTFAQALFGSADAFSSLGPVAQIAVAALQMLGDMFSTLAGEAVAWGSNIIGSLADGMMGAADAVIGILNMIGGMIADLLMPGSPPKLLPGLTDWGAGAISAYMEGWGQADMSVFNGISDAIKSSLDGIAKASGDKGMNVASLVLGSQGQIATAINEIHNLGSVSEGTFNAIIAAAGPAGPQINGIMHAYFDLEAATQNVARAQDELNSVTAQYAAQLDPLKAQLRGIQDQKAQIQDQERLAKLYAEVADAGTDATKRQLDNLEIQEIQTRQQIRTTEAERDTAVGAAKAKLDVAKQQQDAAKAQVDSQKALIDVQNKGNALVAQQTHAMAGAAGAMKGAGSAMAGMAQATAPLASAVQGVNNVARNVSGTLQSVQTVAQTTGATFASVGAMIQSFFAPAIAFVQGNLAAFQGALMGVGVALAGVFVALVAWPAILGAVGAVIGVIGTALGFLLSPIGLLIIGAAALGAAINTNFMGIGDLFAGLGPIFTTITTIIGQVIAAFGVNGLAGAFAALQAGLAVVGPMLAAWGAQLGTVLLSIGQLILANVLTWGQAFISWIAPYVPIVLTALGNLALSIGGWIVAQAPAFIAQLAAWGMAFVNWISPYVGPALAALGGLIGGVLGWIGAQVGPILGQLAAWGAEFIAWIGPMIGPAIAALGGLASAFFGWIAAQAAPIMAQLQTWAQSFIAWIPGATVSFLAAWPGMLGSFLDWIASAAAPILTKLGDWAVSFVAWVAPQIPGILIAVAGIATAILVWIGETALVLGAKVLEWGAAFLDWVGTSVVPKLPGIMDSIKTSISDWITTTLTWMSDQAKSLGTAIVDGIKQGVSNAAKALADAVVNAAKSALNAAGSFIQKGSPSRLFANEIGVPIAEGIAAGIVAATPKATQATLDLASKMVDMVSKGVDAFGKLRDLGTIPSSAVTSFVQTIQDTMNLFGTMTAGWNRSMISAAGQFQAKAGETVDLIAKGVDAISKLRDFKGVPLASISAFADDLGFAILEIVRIATFEMRVALMGAIEFSTGAGKVIEIIGKGVEAFTKLSTFTQLPRGVAQAFSISVLWVVKRIAEVAGWISGEAVASAARFADGAGKVIGLVGSGVDGFMKLATFTQLPAGVAQAFSISILWVVKRIAEVAGWIGKDAVAAAAVFADGAGKVIGLLGAGVEGFTKLSTFVQIPAGVALAFANSISMLISQISGIANLFSKDGVAAAAVFADGAGKVLAILSSGVTGLTALADFGPVSQAGMNAFSIAVNQLMAQLVVIASHFSKDGVAAAAAFADAAGKSVGILKTGVEGFLFVDTFTGVSAAAIVRFADGVRLAVAAMVQLAGEFGADGVAAAAAFAKAAGDSTDFLKKGVEGFNKLSDMQAVPAAALATFSSAVVSLVQTIIDLSHIVTTDVLAQAIRFANGMDQVIQVVSGGLEAITKLGQNAVGIPAFIQAFTASIAKLAQDFAAQVVPPATNIGTNIAIGIANGLTAGIPFIQRAAIAAVNAAIAQMKGALGIASPSAVFRDQIGMQMSAGMAQGVLSGAAGVQAAVGQVAGGVLTAGGGGATTNNNQRSYGSITVNVNAAPGQDARAVGNEVVRQLELAIGGRLA